MDKNIYATFLPFELVVTLDLWKGSRRLKPIQQARLVDLVFEPPIYDDGVIDATTPPAFVFALWPQGKDAAYQAACIVAPDTDPATLTPEYLAGREWSVGKYRRFDDRTLRCAIDFDRPGESAAAALARAGAPLSRRAVYDFQRRRRDAILEFEKNWMTSEAARLAASYRPPDETPAERNAADLRDAAANLGVVLAAGLTLDEMGAVASQFALSLVGEGESVADRAGIVWLANLTRDAATKAHNLAEVYRRYQGHVAATVAAAREKVAE